MIERDLKFIVKAAICTAIEVGTFLLAISVFFIVIFFVGIAGYAGLKAFAGMMGVC